ncbi:hypothetical protein Rsub_07597 [Raphidocelis subcapitata]|uniref:PsbP C-terminal domain-containing protein n=1 Tax=Raphidocelis subcapitata TaxID=307507 RepID=A0A2V0P4C2_9CHLO|nr:hypothetical protein Rsub_07597 [Raphidocelis subcapitata]|eukprot:GBF94714.1 hypothetical protein Rsub_07597 [Raphidocelis subcapitata]
MRSQLRTGGRASPSCRIPAAAGSGRTAAAAAAAVPCRAQAERAAAAAQQEPPQQPPAAVGRRAAFARAAAAAALLAAAAAPAPPAARAEAAEVAAPAAGGASLTRYEDAEGFAINVPAGWGQGEGQLSGNSSFTGATGSRRTLAWFPTDGSASPSDVNVTITITNTSLEFTKLGSFGNATAFGQNMVNSMDTSFFARAKKGADNPDIQVAKLLDANERNDMYWIEYTVQKPALEEQARHLLSAVALGFNGRYNRLITVTAQCREEQVESYTPLFKQMLGSFTPPKRQVL